MIPKKKTNNIKEASAASTAESEEVLLTLLQRLQRSTHTTERPPDEASAALGKQVALKVQSLLEQDVISKKGLLEKCRIGLLSPKVNPSVLQAFLTTLLQLKRRRTTVSLDWLPSWITYCEDICFPASSLSSSSPDVTTNTLLQEQDRWLLLDALTALLRTYAQYQQLLLALSLSKSTATTATSTFEQTSRPSAVAPLTPLPTSEVSDPIHSISVGIANTYRKLSSLITKSYMLREFTKVAFTASISAGEHAVSNIRNLLSPLMACTVLTLSHPLQESTLFLEGVWRECWNFMGIQTPYVDVTMPSVIPDSSQDPAASIADDSSLHVTTTEDPHLEDLLHWMTTVLQYFLWSLPLRNSFQDQIAGKELAYRWMMQLLELGNFILVPLLDDSTEEEEEHQQLLLDEPPPTPTTSPFSTSHHERQERNIQSLTNLSQWLQTFLSTAVIPWTTTIVPTYRIGTDSLWSQSWSMIQKISTATSAAFPWNPVMIFRLSALCLYSPIPQDTNMILKILSTTVPSCCSIDAAGKRAGTKNSSSNNSNNENDNNHTNTMLLGMLRGVASIYIHNDHCSASAKGLIQTCQLYCQQGATKATSCGIIPSVSSSNTTQKTTTTSRKVPPSPMRQAITNVLQMIQDENDDDTDMIISSRVHDFLTFLSRDNAFGDGDNPTKPLTSMQQVGALILGIGLLSTNSYPYSSSSSHPNSTAAMGGATALTFMSHLLHHYSHLGISVLPIWMDTMNTAAIKGNGVALIEQLEFMVSVVVIDPQCAKEVWNVLGVEFMKPSIPVVIRASILRLFPKLVATNKRLYRRVMDVLGMNLSLYYENGNPHAIHELHDEDDSDAASAFVSNSNPLEIPIAVAATIAELAKEDQIRDVTDVIGWIQGFLVDSGWIQKRSTLDAFASTGNAALVHYAILSLHYLVVAQELDFALVLTVLKKRLVNVHDIQQVTKLPLVILESLALLLGDGECDDNEGDDDGDEMEGAHQGSGGKSMQPTSISFHVSKSVETLIHLCACDALHPATARGDEMKLQLVLKCRRNIFQSLSRYSLEALGMEDEGIRAVVAARQQQDTVTTTANLDERTKGATPPIPPSGMRYCTLRQLIEDEMAILASHSLRDIMQDDETDDGDTAVKANGGQSKVGPALSSSPSSSISADPVVALACKLIKYEEEVLGSTLWQKRGKLRKGSTHSMKKLNRHQASQALPGQTDALPSSAVLQQIYNKNRSTASALAVLLCFEGKPLSLLSDMASDMVTESSPDPLVQTFYVQAWLNAARRTLTQVADSEPSRAQGLEQILLDIREWRFRLEAPDNMFLALSSLLLYIPEVFGQSGDFSALVEEIFGEVTDAYTEHEFESSDIGKICLGMIGVCAARSRSMERVDEIVESLEKSVTSYGGQSSFGAYYGLAIIAQSIHASLNARDKEKGIPEEEFHFLGRINGFLLNELVSFIEGNHKSLVNLVVCIREGEISAEIIDSLTGLRKKELNLVLSKRNDARALFIALAISLPGLASINDELLLGVYCLLESLKWGSGKGIALPPVLRACRKSGLFENKEIEKIYAKYAKVFEEGMDKGLEGLDDIFLAVTASMTKTMPYSIRRFLVGNRTLFDEDGRAVSVLAAAVSISSIPCLGCAAELFTELPQLSQAATKDDVSGVVHLLEAGAGSREWDKYSQVATILLGFMASMKAPTDADGQSLHRDSTSSPYSRPSSAQSDAKISQLPVAIPGTVLEVVMTTLSQKYYHLSGETDQKAEEEVLRLLGCLEVLSLPGHFAEFLEQMFRGSDSTKAACALLLTSQIRGRPRAVFDGREYLDLALRVSTTPISALRSLLGQGRAPGIFIESLVHLVPKFPSNTVEEAVENIWRLCINQVSYHPAWTMSFLSAVKVILKNGSEKKPLSMSPKTLNFIRLFVLTRVFAGIRDAPWAATSGALSIHESSIIEMYSACLMEMPITSLMEVEFFSLKDLDGFVGEALRSRCVMILVRLGYFTTPSRASNEVSSAIAWFSRQLISAEDEVFSSALLQVACIIAEATSVENSDRKREILLSFLDNLLLTPPTSSMVGLYLLSALVAQWCGGAGSDGDLSLTFLCVTGMGKWQAFSPPTLQQMFRLLAHDLPFNLALYARREKLSAIIFNRLWRIYNKWWESGAEQETIDCLRKALLCCRSSDSGEDDFASFATTILL